MCDQIKKEEELKILNFYNQGLSIGRIHKLTGNHVTTIKNSLIRNNIKIEKRLRKKYIIKNENYFENIDTQNKAYILGLLSADGYNNQKEAKVIIELLEKDKEILEQISNEIYKNYILKNRLNSYNHPTSKIVIYSRKISDDLSKLGCIQKKSLILDFPNIKEELLSHYLRGYFDGDGCLSLRKKDKNGTLSFMASKIFNDKLEILFKTKFNIHSKSYWKKGTSINVTQLCIAGNRQILKILDWLYKDANIFLNRKYNRYIELKNHLK